jgi:hypothetical protein
MMMVRVGAGEDETDKGTVAEPPPQPASRVAAAAAMRIERRDDSSFTETSKVKGVERQTLQS